MRTRWDLGTSTWLLRGWRQHDWERSKTFVRAEDGQPDIAPIPARVPGSVRGALLEAGIVPSPYVHTGSRASEWIENRHWSYTTALTDEQVAQIGQEGQVGATDAVRLVLVATSLDYAGVVLVDSTEVGTFVGAAIGVEVDLTDAVRAGGRTLTIVFDSVPDDLGQIGRTSRIREWKARFGYGWDWTPRIVQIGIAGPLALEVRSGVTLEAVAVLADLDLATGAGLLRVRADAGGTDVAVTVEGPDVVLATSISGNGQWHDFAVEGVSPWRVAAGGTLTTQVRYAVRLTLPDGESVTRHVGFRHVEWHANEGAPEGAEPWICVVNGAPTFMAGVNWVPIRPDYADVTPEQYRARLEAYVGMGITMLRVWGGALLEQEVFYEMADELGLLVWQELPLSSSGIDNTPPEDADFAREFAEIAGWYAASIAHHPCLVLWGGGNELIEPSETVPLSGDHPAIVAARTALAEADPGRRFVTTSPLGPTVWGEEENYGKGLHHDVHGPWESAGTEQEWRRYWDGDDALLRSEVGVGGASGLDLLTAFELTGPTDTAEERESLRQLWLHSSAWWVGPFVAWDGTGGLATFVEASQRRQADWLGYAASRTRARFPRAGGFIVWLGHDTFPCAVSLSVLDFDGRPKPVAAALRSAFLD